MTKLSTAKKKAATAFQLFIRLRDSDIDGYGSCCTCGKRAHYKEVDAGHFISRAVSATLFDEVNTNFQCKRCNGFLGGAHHLYRKFLIRKHGEDAVKALEQRAGMLCKRTLFDYQTIEKQYKEKIRQLQKQSWNSLRNEGNDDNDRTTKKERQRNNMGYTSSVGRWNMGSIS